LKYSIFGSYRTIFHEEDGEIDTGYIIGQVNGVSCIRGGCPESRESAAKSGGSAGPAETNVSASANEDAMGVTRPAPSVHLVSCDKVQFTYPQILNTSFREMR